MLQLSESGDQLLEPDEITLSSLRNAWLRASSEGTSAKETHIPRRIDELVPAAKAHEGTATTTTDAMSRQADAFEWGLAALSDLVEKGETL